MQNKLLWVMVGVATMLMTSCGVSKEARGQRNLFSGSWTLENVSYENNSGNFKSVLFGDADDICFEGSDWFFRDNNSTGRYTIKGGSLCQGGDRFFRWAVVKPASSYNSQFTMKFIDENRKDISGGTGYRLTIAEIGERAMTLKSNVSVDGEPVTIVYEFSKK